ncbi:hypothetical protein [Alkalihalobacillus sp. BA299]|uniref:hypothetical protein n=1 Tax=Alkalihalobacillus sp. BA299 TaxID=2815938 RepID=UPI001ADB00BE|nr:hypothetical protein [Alkalihalobacillus sp. BA299]
MAKRKNEEAWAEAKKRCRLNQAEIKMAKELGMTPKSLIKNIPSSKQQWKAPVKIWIRDLYEERFGKTLTVKPALNQNTNTKQKREEKPVISKFWDDEELPF